MKTIQSEERFINTNGSRRKKRTRSNTYRVATQLLLFIAVYRKPAEFWGFMANYIEKVRKSQVNEAYKTLQRIIKHKGFKDYFVTTSNVDGMFERAGFDPDKLWEVHGSLFHLQCQHGGIEKIPEDFSIPYDHETYLAKPPYPTCTCSVIKHDDGRKVHVKPGPKRPNIIFFRDKEFNPERSDFQSDKYLDFGRYGIHNYSKFVVLEIGSTKANPTMKHLSENLVGSCTSAIIRINPDVTQQFL